MENEITKIIEGYNKEKEILITKMANVESHAYLHAEAKIKDIKERIKEIDLKIDDVVSRLLKNPK